MGRSPIADRGSLIVTGTVRAQLPSGLYDVEIEGPHRVMAHIGEGRERNFVRLIVGDRVVIELTRGNRSRGRVVKKAP